MSLVDKVIAAVTPTESDEARLEARAKIRGSAVPGSWLDMVLSHHIGIESAFARASKATTGAERHSARRRLAVLLSGHANAEEAVIYPALALNGERRHAQTGYTEQNAAKIEMAALDELDPMSQDYLDKLERIREATAHHVYEEEGSRFLNLFDKISPALHGKLTRRYAEEYERYVGGSMPRIASGWT